jgi:hypothetical protein
MFPNTEKTSQGYYDAIQQILVYQFEHQRAEWLLFITTMVKPGVVSADGLNTLCIPTRENYDKYREFAELVDKHLPPGVFSVERSAVELSTLTGLQLVHLFGVALGKWILDLCESAKPRWIVEMRPSYRYTINEHKGAEMLSLAFELRPHFIPPTDRTGMARTRVRQPRKFPDEAECAVKVVKSVAAIKDVEAELAADPDLRARLRDASATLLESAGYDRAAYLEWEARDTGLED